MTDSLDLSRMKPLRLPPADARRQSYNFRNRVCFALHESSRAIYVKQQLIDEHGDASLTHITHPTKMSANMEALHHFVLVLPAPLAPQTEE